MLTCENHYLYHMLHIAHTMRCLKKGGSDRERERGKRKKRTGGSGRSHNDLHDCTVTLSETYNREKWTSAQYHPDSHPHPHPPPSPPSHTHTHTHTHTYTQTKGTLAETEPFSCCAHIPACSCVCGELGVGADCFPRRVWAGEEGSKSPILARWSCPAAADQHTRIK